MLKKLGFYLFAIWGGAFNDNFFKIILLYLISTQYNSEYKSLLISLTGALLVLPFILFAPIAGYFADRFRKSRTLFFTRLFEPLFILFGAYFIHINNIYGLLFVMFLFGLQSAIFSPSKFGIIAELVARKNLTTANGLVELTTFLGILLGTAVGGQLHLIVDNFELVSIIILASVSFLSIFSAYKIPLTPVQNQNQKLDINCLSKIKNISSLIKNNSNLFTVMLASCWFWFVGALFQLCIFLFPDYSTIVTEKHLGLLVTALIIGIGLGSALVGYLARYEIGLKFVHYACLVLSTTICLLAFISFNILIITSLFFLIGVAAGFYIVPLNAFFQANSPDALRGSFLAVANIYFNVSILLASFFLWFLTGLCALSLNSVFILLGIASFFVFISLRKLCQKEME